MFYPICSTDHIIRQAVITPDDMTSSELNQRIAHFNTQLKTAAIFILDTQGKAIASSNWQDPRQLCRAKL